MDDEDEDVPTCPLCLEELDATDRAVKACQCGYQVCLWCLHTIRERLNRRCPACRTVYEEQNFKFDDVNPEQAAKEAKERKTAKKERERREKLKEIERERARAIVLSQQKAKNNLKHARILQRNLVYVIGLSLTLAREEVIRRADMFAKFGKVMRILVNRSHPFNADAPGGPSISAYVQYYRDADAMAAVRAMNNTVFDGREIRCAIATTKYCDTYVRNVQTGDLSSTFLCGNSNCMYYHTTPPPDTVLTKEEALARQLGPPPPAHLFLPPVPRRQSYPTHHRAPAATPSSAQQPSHASNRPALIRSQLNSTPSSQLHSSTPALHPMSGPLHQSSSFPTNMSSTVPVSTAASASASSFSPLATFSRTPSAPPDAAHITASPQWTPPLSPHVEQRPESLVNRSPIRQDGLAPGSPGLAPSPTMPLSSSLPLSSSAAWASTQPGHPVSQSPMRRSPQLAVDEPYRVRPLHTHGHCRDVPPGFEESTCVSSPPPGPSQPPGFDVPPPHQSVLDDAPTLAHTALQPVRSSPIPVPFSSAVPSSAPLAPSVANPDVSPAAVAKPMPPPPGFGPGLEAEAEPVQDSRQRVAAAWSQEASTDKVFSVSDRRTAPPVGDVAARTPPASVHESGSRAGLEKVLASIGGSLGVSSEFQVVAPVPSPHYLQLSVSLDQTPAPHVNPTLTRNCQTSISPHARASLFPTEDIVMHSRLGGFHGDIQVDIASTSGLRRSGDEAGSSVSSPLMPGSALLPSYFGAQSADVARRLALSIRRNRSRFAFAQEDVKKPTTVKPGTGTAGGVIINRDLDEVKGPHGSDAIPKTQISDITAPKNQGIVPQSRQARSRFDFADRGCSPPRHCNLVHSAGAGIGAGADYASGVVPAVSSVSSSVQNVIRDPYVRDVFEDSFHHLSTEEKLESIFTSAKWSPEPLPPMPLFEPRASESMSEIPSRMVSVPTTTGMGLNRDMVSIANIVDGHAGIGEMAANLGGAPDIVDEGDGYSGPHLNLSSVALPPPGFREATPGIAPDTTADAKTSATTGVASKVVSGGSVSIHRAETTTSAVAVSLEEAVSSGTESLEDDRKRSRAQRKRERKARQVREASQRKLLKGNDRGGRIALHRATSGGDGARVNVNVSGSDGNMVEQVTKATAAVVGVHSKTKPSGAGISEGSSEANVIARSIQLTGKVEAANNRKSSSLQASTKGRSGEEEGKRKAGALVRVGNEGVGVNSSGLDLDLDSHVVLNVNASTSGIAPTLPKDDGSSLSKFNEDGGKFMSVSELEREVEAARVREAQLQDKLMEITRRLRSYDNVRT